MESPAELLLTLVANVVGALGAVLPRVPARVTELVGQVGDGLSTVLQSVPYIEIVPWDTVGLALAAVPFVWAYALSVRMILRVWAWVRSRGISDY